MFVNTDTEAGQDIVKAFLTNRTLIIIVIITPFITNIIMVAIKI